MNPRLEKLLNRFSQEIKSLQDNKVSGMLTFEIHSKDGGITSSFVNLKELIKDGI